MAKLQSMAILVALGLASATLVAQEQTTPNQADTQATPPSSTESSTSQSPEPSSASSPHQREATKMQTPETSPNGSPETQSASSPHQRGAVGETPSAAKSGAAPKMTGMKVQSPSGESLGTVVGVTMDASRQPEFVVISTGNDTTTAVPYSTASSMVHGNMLVMDRTKLQNSPQVAQSELQDKSNTKWRSDADKYWTSQGNIRSASPGNSQYPQPQQR